MNIFSKNIFKINFDSYLQRVSLQNETNLISISESSFRVLLALMNTEEKYNRLITEEGNVKVEITKILNNFRISTYNKIFFYWIFIDNQLTDIIKSSEKDITQKIDDYKQKKKRKLPNTEMEKNIKKLRQRRTVNKEPNKEEKEERDHTLSGEKYLYI